jgi:hypothetical protein
MARWAQAPRAGDDLTVALSSGNRPLQFSCVFVAHFLIARALCVERVVALSFIVSAFQGNRLSVDQTGKLFVCANHS